MADGEVKRAVYGKARELGVNLVRTCSADAWEERPVQDPEFWPRNIWPWASRVVVLGMPLFAPMMATAPSMVYQELYDTSNRVLDDIAYLLSNYVTTLGYRAMYFPRDCYFNINVLEDDPRAAFSHVLAAYYAGMGTIGDSHNLVTTQFGPRLRIVSILTDAPIEPDPMLEHDLCIHCEKCLRSCPVRAFTHALQQGQDVYDMDAIACTKYHEELVGAHHWPCGICAAVCPVGEDVRRYQMEPMVTPEGIAHCQRFGS
ncbi:MULTISPECIES: 4Fe-4S dicluster domain-containing protein [Collinsella]|uniref:4Fe-4S dicluster domain-containing protein n=1 Tax=Collinsella TaxID=102106 RepID=UPI00082FD0E1|nr:MULTISPECIES: 4Fe-4S dicluster domain-containing protein [Collinsella]